MLLAAHAISGGVIGEELNSPYLAFLIGFLFHFVLDLIPHYDLTSGGKWDLKQITYVGADAVIGVLVIILYIKPEYSLANPFWWGALGCVLLDLMDNIPLWQGALKKTKIGGALHSLHDKCHWYAPNLVFGVLTQVVVIGLFLILLSK